MKAQKNGAMSRDSKRSKAERGRRKQRSEEDQGRADVTRSEDVTSPQGAKRSTEEQGVQAQKKEQCQERRSNGVGSKKASKTSKANEAMWYGGEKERKRKQGLRGGRLVFILLRLPPSSAISCPTSALVPACLDDELTTSTDRSGKLLVLASKTQHS